MRRRAIAKDEARNSPIVDPAKPSIETIASASVRSAISSTTRAPLLPIWVKTKPRIRSW